MLDGVQHIEQQRFEVQQVLELLGCLCRHGFFAVVGVARWLYYAPVERHHCTAEFTQFGKQVAVALLHIAEKGLLAAQVAPGGSDCCCFSVPDDRGLP